MANTTKLKPRRVNSFNEPSDGKNLGYKNDDQFKWQDGGGGHQSFFKTRSEYDALPASKESDGNLYIIVDNHLHLLSYAELIQLTPQEIVAELNKASTEYVSKFNNEGHLYNRKLSDNGENARYRTIDRYNVQIGFTNESLPHRDIIRPVS